MYKNKKVLVTGGSGVIGRELVKSLVKDGAKVTSISLDDNNFDESWNVEYIKGDLRDFDTCVDACKGKEFVFHIAGIKGSPLLVKQKPYVFFTSFLQMNTNMIAAMNASEDMEWGLYTSTVGTYGQAEVFYEDKMWEQFPSKNDWFAGWSKRMGELQIDAIELQAGKRNISIMKPVNVYGEYDNFDLRSSTLVPSLIRKVFEATDTVDIWGKGIARRDCMHASDVAIAAKLLVSKKVDYSVNVGRGESNSILSIIKSIIEISGKDLEIVHDLTKPSGDDARIANIDKLKALGFVPKKSLIDGLTDTYKWYEKNLNHSGRFDPFFDNDDYTNKF